MATKTAKFYRRREVKLLRELGFEPTKASGAGWIEKEDGYNDEWLCQLKTTSNTEGFGLKVLDLDKLEEHARVEHKRPVLIVDFEDLGRQYGIIPYDLLLEVIGKVEQQNKVEANGIFTEEVSGHEGGNQGPRVVSSNKARQKFKHELEVKYGKGSGKRRV